MQTLDMAQDWINQGIGVLPIGYRDKRPDFHALKRRGYVGNDGRSSWEALKTNLPSTNDLRAWFGGERRNLGIITGWQGLVVIDFDTFAAYQTWYQWLGAMRIQLDTYQVITGRGVHVYVMIEAPTEAYKVADIDVKAAGGYVLAPPSVHPSGHTYAAIMAAIAHVGQLSDIFPLEQPTACEVCTPNQDPIVYTDPLSMAIDATEEERISDGSVLRIKSALTWHDVLGPAILSAHHGVMMICCPIHHDTQPSMALYPDGKFYCYGCRAHGDLIDMYAILHGLDQRGAIRELARKVA